MVRTALSPVERVSRKMGQLPARYPRARPCGNKVAPLIVLTGIEKGTQPLPPQGATKITNYIALFLAPEKGRKRAPAQGPIKITSQREIL